MSKPARAWCLREPNGDLTLLTMAETEAQAWRRCVKWCIGPWRWFSFILRTEQMKDIARARGFNVVRVRVEEE